MNIVDFLEHGEENARSQRELSVRKGEPIRKIRAEIWEARIKGAVILSNPDKDSGGYYLPKNNEEVRRYIAFQQHRINSAKEAMKSAEEFLKRGGFNEP